MVPKATAAALPSPTRKRSVLPNVQNAHASLHLLFLPFTRLAGRIAVVSVPFFDPVPDPSLRPPVSIYDETVSLPAVMEVGQPRMSDAIL